MPPVTKAELKEGGLFSKWEAIANKYDTLNDQLTDPAVLSQSTLLVSLNKVSIDGLSKRFPKPG
jgi:hypothetical protein